MGAMGRDMFTLKVRCEIEHGYLGGSEKWKMEAITEKPKVTRGL